MATPLDQLQQKSSEGPGLIQLTIQAEEERKRKEAEEKRRAAAAKKAAAAAQAAERKRKSTPAQGRLPFPSPLNAYREAIKPGPKSENPVLGFVKGVARAGDRALVQTVESLVEAVPTTALSILSVQQRLNPGRVVSKALKLPWAELPKELDPLDEKYREWQLNLPKSEAGNQAVETGANLISFVATTIGLARRLPETGLAAATKGAPKLKQAAVAGITGLPASAAASWLLTKRGDPNLANMVDSLPFGSQEFKNALKLGLATDEKDSAFTSKAKAMVTDGLVGAPADAALFLLFARKWTQGLLKEGIRPDEAITRGVAAAAEELEKFGLQRGMVANAEWPEASRAQFGELADRAFELEQRAAEIQARLKGPKQGELDLESVTQEPTPPPEPGTQLELELETPNTRKEGEESPTPPEVDPDEIELKRVNDELKGVLREMDELEAELATPADLLAPNEVRGSAEAVPADEALKDQVRLETQVPAGAKRADIPEGLAKAPATAPDLGAPRHTYTDAAAKIMASDPKATKQVMGTLRKTLEKKTLTLLAKESSLSEKQLLEQAVEVITKFRGPEVQALDKDEFLAFLQEAGAMKTVQDPTLTVDSAELLNPIGVVALKTMVTDTAAQIYQLSRGLLKDDLAQKLPGNQADRLIDRIMVLHDLHQMTMQITGRDLWSGKLTATGKSARGTKKVNRQRFGPDGSPQSAEDLDKARREGLKQWAKKAKRAFRLGNQAEYADEMRKIAAALVMAGGDPLKTRTMWSLIREGLWKNTMTQWYNSVLSGTATLIRAGAGNFNSFLATPVATGMSGLFKGDVRMMKAGMAAYRGITDSLWDALKVARDTASLNEGLMADAKYIVELQANNTQLADMRRILEDSPDFTPGQDVALRYLETLAKFNQSWAGSFPERFMLGIDDFTKVVASRAKIAMDASYKAFDEGGTTADFERVYDQMKQSRIDPQTFEIKDQDLFDYTKMATFQGDPGGIVKSIEMLLNAAPWMRLVIPFVRTPGEVMNYQWELLPVLNNLSVRYRRVMRLKPGDEGFDPVLRAEMEGRQAVGAMAVTAATIAAFDGRITGNGPPPGPQRQLWLKTHKPKSIRTPFGWVSYAPIDPLQAWLSLAADVADLVKMGHYDEADKVQAMLMFGFQMAITDRSMLQGVAGLGSFLNGRSDGSMETIDAGFWTMVNGFIPWAGQRQAFKSAFDPVAKEIEGHINKVFDNLLPGYYQQHPSRVSPFSGIEQHSLSGGVWNAFVPFHIHQGTFPKGSPEEKEQRVVGYLTEAGWDSSTLLTEKYGGGELAPAERSAFARALHKEGLTEALLDLFENNEFVKVGLETWKATGNSGTARDQPFYKAIVKTINGVKRKAFQTMLQDNPNLAQRQALMYQQSTLLEQGRPAEAEVLQKQIDELLRTP
jgi:hypothetical protein